MYITGIIIDNKVRLITDNQELSLFIKSYVENNIEPLVPHVVDSKGIAVDLQKSLEQAFNIQFSVEPLDVQTGDPIDDLSTAAFLEVSTPLNVHSVKIH